MDDELDVGEKPVCDVLTTNLNKRIICVRVVPRVLSDNRKSAGVFDTLIKRLDKIETSSNQ